jgi:pyruvate ferredoxin oxidoreductase delta subunit
MTTAKSTTLKPLDWQRSWEKIPRGGVIPAGGTSTAYETGTWRSFKPIWDAATCTHCLLCWVYCPDGAILVENDKVVGVAYEYCKGCGVCVHECPKEGAIAMAPEHVVVNG